MAVTADPVFAVFTGGEKGELMRAAKIVNGVVETYIEVGEFTADWVAPADSKIGYAWDGEKFTAPVVFVDLPALKVRLAAAVDDHIAVILQRWLRFQAGYVKREAAAREYVAAGCTGDPGIWITAFAEPAGLSSADAAALILMQAEALNTALEKLEAARMAKYSIHAATTPEAAEAEYQSIIATADAIARELK